MISRKARHRFKANGEGHMSLMIEQRPRQADGEEKVERIQSEAQCYRKRHRLATWLEVRAERGSHH